MHKALVNLLVHGAGHALNIAHPQAAHRQLSHHEKQHAQGQGPQGFKNAVMNHLVVDQHGIQRGNDHAQIDKEAGQSQPTPAAPHDRPNTTQKTRGRRHRIGD